MHLLMSLIKAHLAQTIRLIFSPSVFFHVALR